jgi:hypothetical protein
MSYFLAQNQSNVSSTASQNIRNIINHHKLLEQILTSPADYGLGKTEVILRVDSETKEIFDVGALTRDTPDELDEDDLTSRYNARDQTFKEIVDFVNNPIGVLKGIFLALISLSSINTNERLITKKIVSVKKLFARLQKILLVFKKFVEIGGKSNEVSSLHMILEDIEKSLRQYILLKKSIQEDIMISNAKLEQIKQLTKSAKPEIEMIQRERDELNELVIKEHISEELEVILVELDMVFSILNKIMKKMKKNKITKESPLVNKLNAFILEMTKNDDFDEKLKEVITEYDAREEVEDLKTKIGTDSVMIESQLEKMRALMLGLSQYDDIIEHSRESRSRSLSRSRSRSRDRIHKAASATSKNSEQSKSRSRSRSREDKNKKADISGGKKRRVSVKKSNKKRTTHKRVK